MRLQWVFNFSFAAESKDQRVVNAALDTLVVTATRSEEKIGNVPARINIIKPKILEQSPIASLPDLLMTDPAITVVQSGGYGQASSIFLRGAESDQALVLRDSVRLNSATSGAASLPFIDTTDIKQIEVLKGQHLFYTVQMQLVVLYNLSQKHQLKQCFHHW